MTGEPVQIISVRSNCDCITARADKDKYEAAERGVILVLVETRATMGAQESVIEVKADDAPNTPTMLKLVLERPIPIRLEHRILAWERDEVPVEKHARIFVMQGAAAVTNVECDNDVFSVRIAPDNVPGYYQIGVTPLSTTASVRANVRIDTTINDRRQIFSLRVVVN
jgi:hypothetical protein